MSRIYFHAIDGEAEVYGSERAHFGILVNDIALAVLAPENHFNQLKGIMNEDSYVNNSKNEYEFARNFRLWFSVSSFNNFLIIEDEKTEPFEIGLNTALTLGNDPIKLAARIHGQCEIHCFVEGKNRKWMAGIIRHARKENIYRSNMGWESVIDLLESSEENPVVLSYSVCEQFPNAGAANYSDDYDEDGWYKLPIETQWSLALDGIRKEKGLEIKPENWNDFYFTNGINAFDVIELITKKPESSK